MCACDNCNLRGGFGCPNNNTMGGDIGGLCGFGDFSPDPFYEQNESKKKQKILKEAVERHAPAKVIGGLIAAGREDYAANRLILTVEETVEEGDFEGIKLHEAYIEAASTDGMSNLSDSFYFGRPVIIDAKTGRILESLWVPS